MANSDPHTVKAFDEEIEEVRARVATMGGILEAAIRDAIQAILHNDDIAAAQAVVSNGRVEVMAQEVERLCVRLIALRAPMADDLRDILASFKIAILIARMSGCARRVAEQVHRVKNFPYRRPLKILDDIASAVAGNVQSALTTFAAMDGEMARKLVTKEDSIGDLQESLFDELLLLMTDTPSAITPSTSLLFASQKLERIRDHAMSIARVAFFASTGDHMPDMANHPARVRRGH